MKTKIKKLLLPFLFILAFAFTQQVQAQETKEYVTVSVVYGNDAWKGYVIVYPDGTTEKGELGMLHPKNQETNAIKINSILNMLAKKGYKLVSSNGGSDPAIGGLNLFYIFEK